MIIFRWVSTECL